MVEETLWVRKRTIRRCYGKLRDEREELDWPRSRRVRKPRPWRSVSGAKGNLAKHEKLANTDCHETEDREQISVLQKTFTRASASTPIFSYIFLFSPLKIERKEWEEVLLWKRLYYRINRVVGEEYRKDYREMRFPLIEQFFWKRIVYDEFHEPEGNYL